MCALRPGSTMVRQWFDEGLSNRSLPFASLRSIYCIIYRQTGSPTKACLSATGRQVGKFAPTGANKRLRSISNPESSFLKCPENRFHQLIGFRPEWPIACAALTSGVGSFERRRNSYLLIVTISIVRKKQEKRNLLSLFLLSHSRGETNNAQWRRFQLPLKPHYSGTNYHIRPLHGNLWLYHQCQP